jgi:hypothetical protein
MKAMAGLLSAISAGPLLGHGLLRKRHAPVATLFLNIFVPILNQDPVPS